MKKILIFFLSFLVIIGCSKKEEAVEEKNEEKDISSIVEEKLNNLTLDEKIGQMLIIYYKSSSMDEVLKSSLEEVKPGGFILLKENFSSYDNTLNFINEIKESSSIPMFIAINQEGGAVQTFNRLSDVTVTEIPSMYELGKLDNENLSYQVGTVIAKELKTLGINMNLAPVLDLYDEGNNQAFSSNLEIISKNAINLAKGMEENGIIAVYKRYPGYGSTNTDLTKELPIVNKSKEELLNSDLIPYQKVIENNAKAIMVTHIAYPNITFSNTPASLSKTMINTILRSELGFKGVVISDAVNNGALTNHNSYKEIYQKMINAGVDMILMPPSSKEALTFIKESIEEGIITEDKINEAVRRILTLKESLNNDILDRSILNNEEHQNIIKQITNSNNE